MGDSLGLIPCIGCSGSGHTYDGPTAMFDGVTESGLGGAIGWTYGSAWDGVGRGGVKLPGGPESTDTLDLKIYGATFGSPAHSYP